MNIIEAAELLKQGAPIQRPSWGDTAIKVVQTGGGGYQIYATGQISAEISEIMAADFECAEVDE